MLERLTGRTGLAGQAFSATAATAVTGVLGLVFWTLAAGTSAAEDVGRLAVLVTLGQLAGMAAGAGAGPFLVLNLATVARPARTAAGTVGLAAVGGTLTGAAVAAAATALGVTDGGAWLIVAASPAVAVGTATDGILAAQSRTQQVAVRHATFGLVRIGLLLAGVGGLEQVWAAGLGAAGAYGIAAAAARPLPRAEDELRRTPPLTEPAWHHAITLAAAAPVLLLPTLVDARAGAAAAATFHLAWQLASVAHVTAPAAAGSALIRIGRTGDVDGNITSARRLHRRMYAAAAAVTIAAGPVVAAAVGYAGLAWTVVGTVACGYGAGATTLVVGRLRSERRWAKALAVTAAQGALVLAAAAAGGAGAPATAYALAAAYAVAGTAARRLERRREW